MYKHRNKLDFIKKIIEKEAAVILIGTRQVGKSVLMNKIKEDIKNQAKQTLYFDLEFPSSLNLFSEGVEGFLLYLKAQGIDIIRDELYIFIDEFQYIPNAGKFLKALIDNFPKLKIVASGSSSVEIQNALKESLAGRKRVIKIFPLDFLEYLYFNDREEANFFSKLNIDSILNKTMINILQELFSSFAIWGGMPKAVLEKEHDQRIMFLEEICSAYLQKDIKGLVDAQHLNNFNNLMLLLAAESSCILSIDSLSRTLSELRRDLEKYLFILENTFVNFQINPFFTNKRKELSKVKKSVFYDTGIRNVLMKNTGSFSSRSDKGYLVETVIYNEIMKNLYPGMDILYWRTLHQTEVDFVLKYNEALVPIEVKASDIKNVPKSLVSFAKQYNSPFGVVLNKSIWNVTKLENITVYFLPHFVSSRIPLKVRELAEF